MQYQAIFSWQPLVQSLRSLQFLVSFALEQDLSLQFHGGGLHKAVGVSQQLNVAVESSANHYIEHIEWQEFSLEGDRSFPSLQANFHPSSHLKNPQTKIAFPASWKSPSLPQHLRLVVND